MMITPGPLTGLPLSAPADPAVAPSTESATSASAQGFLAALGAAIQQAMPQASAPVPAPAALPLESTEELPGDLEQADGWRGPSVPVDAVTQTQVLARPVAAAPMTWATLLQEPEVPPPTVATAPTASETPNVSQPTTPAGQTAPLQRAPSPRAVSGIPPKPAAVPVSAAVEAKPTSPKGAAVTGTGRTAAKAATVPAEEAFANPKAEPVQSAPEVPSAIGAADGMPPAQPNVELARLAAQCSAPEIPTSTEAPGSASTAPTRPSPSSATAPVAPRSNPQLRDVPEAAPAFEQASLKSVLRQAPVAASTDSDVIARGPVRIEEVAASTEPVSNNTHVQALALPLPPGVTIRVTESAGSSGTDDRPARGSTPPLAAVPITSAAAVSPVEAADESAPDSSRPARPPVGNTKGRSLAAAHAASAGQPAVPHSTLAAASSRGTEPVTTAVAAAPEVQAARPQEEPAPQPRGVERVTLQLPDNDGGMTRVRISVRGDQVRTTLISSDASTSAQLSSEAPELERALAARGFRGAEVSVPQAVNPASMRETGSGAALGIASADSSSGERLQGNNRHADGSAGESRQGTAERDRESPDQPAEDQPRQGRSHQRARRERAR